MQLEKQQKAPVTGLSSFSHPLLRSQFSFSSMLLGYAKGLDTLLGIYAYYWTVKTLCFCRLHCYMFHMASQSNNCFQYFRNIYFLEYHVFESWYTILLRLLRMFYMCVMKFNLNPNIYFNTQPYYFSGCERFPLAKYKVGNTQRNLKFTYIFF